MRLVRFLKIFVSLLLTLILVKISLCVWRIYNGMDQPSLDFYLQRIDLEIELLKIAFLALLAALISFFWGN